MEKLDLISLLIWLVSFLATTRKKNTKEEAEIEKKLRKSIITADYTSDTYSAKAHAYKGTPTQKMSTTQTIHDFHWRLVSKGTHDFITVSNQNPFFLKHTCLILDVHISTNEIASKILN